jgi:hypothetical protein
VLTKENEVLKRIILILTAAVVMVGLAAVPAQAAPSCPLEHMCIYEASNYQGRSYVFNMLQFSGGQCVLLGTDPTGFNWNDHVNSVFYSDAPWNDTQAQFRKDWPCVGTFVTFVQNSSSSSLSQHSCVQPKVQWDGPCGSSGITAFKVVWF